MTIQGLRDLVKYFSFIGLFFLVACHDGYHHGRSSVSSTTTTTTTEIVEVTEDPGDLIFIEQIGVSEALVVVDLEHPDVQDFLFDGCLEVLVSGTARDDFGHYLHAETATFVVSDTDDFSSANDEIDYYDFAVSFDGFSEIELVSSQFSFLDPISAELTFIEDCQFDVHSVALVETIL